MIDQKICEVEFGTTNLPRLPLFIRKIAPPTTIDYQPFSNILPVSLGQGVTHGFKSVTITWTNADKKTVFELQKLVKNATDRKIYIKIPLNDASVIARKYGGFEGIVHPLDIEESGNMFGGTNYGSVVLFVNNLV